MLPTAGCSSVCKGPGCATEWPLTRVAVHHGDDMPLRKQAWQADATYDGRSDEGARWVLSAENRSLFFGQGEANQVVRVGWRPGDGQYDRLGTWTGTEGFGTAIATADIDGSGRFDLLAGAPDTEFGRGSVFLFPDAGVAGGPTNAEDAPLEIRSASAADRLGEQIVLCSDISGDGLPEILLAAPWFTRPDDASFPVGEIPELSGGVFLIVSEQLRDAAGVVTPYDLGAAWWGEAEGDGAGLAMACSADHDDDDIADVVIGAPWRNDDVESDIGRVYLISGATLFDDAGSLEPAVTRASLGEIATTVIDGDTASSLTGSSVVPLQLTDDGAAALAIGEPGYGGGQGRVTVYPGSELARGGVPKPMVVFTHQGAEEDNFGRWLSSGDLDGDGLQDLVVGAPDMRPNDRVGYDIGHLWVFLAKSSDLWLPKDTPSIADHELIGEHPFQRVGRAPLVADLDGDSRAEISLPTRRASEER